MQRQEKSPVRPGASCRGLRQSLQKSDPPAGEQAPSGKQAATQEKVASQPQPKTTAKEREAQAKARRAWLRTQLKLLLGLSFMLLVLFFLSLLTGQVSVVAIFLIVLTAVGVIVSMVRKIRNPIY